MLSRRQLATLAAAVGCIGAAPRSVRAAGVVRIGQSTSLTGPLAKDCRASLLGAQAYLKAVNDAGGVHGARIELLTLDDGFDERRCAENTRVLVAREQVTGLFQYGGTGPSVAAAKVLEGGDVVLLAPVSGAPFWRDLKQARNVYTVRAGYEREVRALTRQLSTMGIGDAALVLQDAAFTQALLPTARESFQASFGRAPVAEILIDRSEAKAAEAAAKLGALRCRAAILVSTSKPAALFIRQARRAAPGMVIMALSTVAPEQLREELPAAEIRGLGIAQTMPHPTSVRVPVVQEFQAAFRRHTDAAFDYFAVEGYVNARILVAALQRSGPAPTPARFRAGIESLRDFDVGGLRVSFGPRDRTGSTFVDVTVLGQDGQVLR